MKFNRSHITNQRIERITMQTAVVGIDIAKDVHAAQITDFRKRTIASRHLSFSNDIYGFAKLLGWIQKVQSEKGLTSAIVGLEPTGHYWFNLAHWLLEQGVPVVLVNPVATHRTKENRDNSPSKNDPKDALVIADLVNDGNYTEYQPQAQEFERLKALMSDREFWVDHSVSVMNRITRWIDLYFPEFSKVFKNWTGKRPIATLKAFPLPCDLKELSVEDVMKGWREKGMQRVGGVSGREKITELLRAAASSVGDTRALDEARMEITRLVEEYERVQQLLEEIQQRIGALLGDIPMAEQLRSIPKLGTITIATLLGCAGDLRLYKHGRQLLRRAGLNLAERKSGKYEGKIKLSKRGDSMLRKYLYLGMLSLVAHNLEFKQLHAKNVQKGMEKMASIFKCIGKLARIVIGMVQRGERYHPEQMQQQQLSTAA